MKKYIIIAVLLMLVFTSCRADELDELNKALDTCKTELETLKADSLDGINALNNTIKDLESEIDGYNENLYTMENRKNLLQDKNTELENKITNLNSIIEKYNSDISSLKLHNDELVANLNDAYSQLRKPDFSIMRINYANDKHIAHHDENVDFYVYQKIFIYDIRDDMIHPENDIFIESDKNSYLALTFVGTIYNFELIEVVWDDDSDWLVDKSIMYSIPETTDCTIFIPTGFPEGLPNQKVRWEDTNGQTVEFLIGYDGREVNGTITWMIE